MKLLSATETFAFVAIDILGELIRTKCGSILPLVITESFTNLARKIGLKRIMATSVAHSL